MSTYNGSTEALAIHISTAAELAWFGDQMRQGITASGKTYGGKYWKLMNDIDLGGKDDFTGSDWANAVGNTTSAFHGYFDGNNKTISNIQVANVASQKYYGIFTSIQGASAANPSMVKDLKIDGVYFCATAATLANTTRLGALAGYVKQANISNIEISNVKFIYAGNITNENDLGGAIGCTDATTSLNSISVTDVDATFSGTTTKLYVAGLVGKINSLTTITDCSTTDVTISYNLIANESYIAGLVGYTKGSAGAPITINKCTATNTTINLSAGINNSSCIGGFVARAADNTQIGDGTEQNKCIVTSPNISVAGAIKAASYIGGAIGDFAGAAAIISMVDGLTITSPSISLNKVSIKDCRIGSGFGRISTFSSVANASVSNSTFTYGSDVTVDMYVGDVAGSIVGSAPHEVKVLKPSSTGANITINGNVTGNSLYLGGIAGNITTSASINDANVEDANITFNGNVNAGNLYLGGIVGYQKASVVVGASVDNIDITINGDNKSAMYLGGAVGWMNAESSPITSIEQVVVENSKIHTIGTHTYAIINKSLVVGGLVGHVGQSSATSLARVNKSVAQNLDIDLSGFIPESANTNGSLFNQKQNAFVIGGVIGRINSPRELPEHLFFSGKIYAPFAAVGPIVGVFCSSISAATYLYDDYSGEGKLTDAEWEKVDTWYYFDYKLGLSSAVLTQNARTRNFTNATTNIDGVEYLTIDENTLLDFNSINGATKHSKTILSYTANGGSGINPAWNTNSSTYPAYYMYYMQGVNRGTFNDEIDIDKMLVGFAFCPEIVRGGNDENGYVFTVENGNFDPDGNFTISYQWYESDKSTPIFGATSNSLSMSRGELDAVGSTVYCVVTATADGMASFSDTLRSSYQIVVFVDGNNGFDNIGTSRKRGWTPATPVRTIDNANALFNGGTLENNIIVVMGDLKNDGDFLQSHGRNPATITGKWDGIDYEGVVRFRKTLSEDGVNPGDGPGKTALHNYVSADTKFEFLTLDCKNTGSGGSIDNCFFECHGHDVWFGKGIKMKGFRRLSAAHGNLDENDVTPELSIILSATNLAPANVEEYWTRLKPQTLTIESGHYGRILGGRYTGNFFSNPANTSHSIQATAQHPSWAVINIDIDPNNEMTGIEYVSGAAADNPVTYTNDVHCIVAGLTDGTIFGDYQINLHGGKVGYIVGANQGNCIVNGSKTFTPIGSTTSKNFGQWPNSSFYGRTVINVEQLEGLKDVQVANLYAGGLGRDAGSNNTAIPVDMYVYGHTEINVKSGTVLGDIFGGGAGGVIGLGLWDEHVPYATTAENNPSSAIYQGVEYARTGTKQSPLANVTLRNPDGQGGYTEEILNLGDSYTTINVSGGTIGGSVYGGGDGFVSNMEVSKKITMQGVGSVFGTSNVNITGGTIMGSVYGGSKGSDKYFGMVNAYGQTVTHIAEMNGTINLTITGTEDHYPTINGDIYGAGAGVSSSATQEYLRIATAGNTDLGDNYKTNINILVDLPDSHPFGGSIYGGGQMGAVDGDIKVKIRGGVIQGNVYGAGNGEDGHPDKAKVTGNPEVLIGQGIAFPVVIQGSVYGGGHAAAVEGSTQVTLDGPANKSVTVEGHMFGGGHGESAVIKTSTSDETAGNTQVLLKGNVTVGKFQNGHCISGGNVYGGGYGGTVEGNTRVIIGED